MTYLEKEKAKIEKKIKELQEKEHEEFLNFMDTGEAKYDNRRYKAEKEAEELSKFLYAEQDTKRYKDKCQEYELFIQKLKAKINQLKKEYPAKTYPDIDQILGRVYTTVINEEPH